MMNSALGLIEVEGYLGIIAAADTALKAADVKIIQLEKISGGLSTLQVSGDVGAVNAAIMAAKDVVEELGCLRSYHVIPRVDEMVLKIMCEHPSTADLKKTAVTKTVSNNNKTKKEKN